MAHSWLLAAAKLGMDFRLAFPPEYKPRHQVWLKAAIEEKKTGAKILLTSDVEKAVRGADVLYTDVWISMGQENERKKRLTRFQRYQINARLVAKAAPRALIMHCLPAHRGEEITEEMIEGKR